MILIEGIFYVLFIIYDDSVCMLVDLISFIVFWNINEVIKYESEMKYCIKNVLVIL